MTLGFEARISVLLAVILAIGLGITGTLSVQAFNRTLSEFLSTRFEFVVSDLRRRVESQMDLGLELSDISNLRKIMDGYIEDDPQIFTIEVFGEDGTVIHSTDSGFVGDLVSEDWVQAWKEASGDDVWMLFQREAGVVGTTIKDNFNRDIASIALRYSRDLLDSSVRRNGSRLLVIGAVAVIVTAIISLIGVAIVLRSPLRELSRLTTAIRDIDEGSRDGQHPPQYAAYPLEFIGFADQVIAARKTLADATQRIHEIDEEPTK